MYGLLGDPQQSLLGSGTQDLMQQYLMNLFMRRYQPPALNGAQNTVRSQMGPGGMTYMAPIPMAQSLPGQAPTPGLLAQQQSVYTDNQRTPLSETYPAWAAAYRGGQ